MIKLQSWQGNCDLLFTSCCHVFHPLNSGSLSGVWHRQTRLTPPSGLTASLTNNIKLNKADTRDREQNRQRCGEAKQQASRVSTSSRQQEARSTKPEARRGRCSPFPFPPGPRAKDQGQARPVDKLKEDSLNELLDNGKETPGNGDPSLGRIPPLG